MFVGHDPFRIAVAPEFPTCRRVVPYIFGRKKIPRSILCPCFLGDRPSTTFVASFRELLVQRLLRGEKVPDGFHEVIRVEIVLECTISKNRAACIGYVCHLTRAGV